MRAGSIAIAVSTSACGFCRLRLALGMVLTVSLLAAGTRQASASQQRRPAFSPRPLPSVPAEAVEPAVYDQLSKERQAVERLIEQQAPLQEIGRAYGRLGQVHLVYDLVEVAESCFRTAMELDPEELRWPYLLGSRYQLDHRLDEADEAYTRALQIAPNDGPSLVRAADVALELDDSERAERLYRRGLRVAGFEAYARSGLGRLAMRAERPEEAIEHFQAALNLEPGADLLHYQLALAYRETGNLEAAKQHLALRGDRPVRHPDPVAREVQREAAGAGVHLFLGRAALADGATDVAFRRFEEALRVDPENAAAHRSLAGLLESQGRREEAIEHLKAAIESEPTNPGAHYALAELLWGEGGAAVDPSSRQAALDHLREAVALAPRFSAAWQAMALILEEQEELEEALAAWSKAIEGAPRDLRLYHGRAALLLRLDRPEGALEELAVLLTHANDSDSTPLPTRQWLEVGEWLVAHERREQARQAFEHVIAQSTAAEPTSEALSAEQVARAHFNLGNLAAEAGETQAAIHAYREALALGADFLELELNLGTTLGRAGRYGEASRHLHRVIELDPERDETRFAEAMALVLAGEGPKARSRLEEALTKRPGHPLFSHLLARLLVTASDDAVRDPERGLRLAREVMQALPTPNHAETLAMALAENGRFEEAIQLQQQVIAELERRGAAAPVAAARRRLRSYEGREAVRSPWRE